MKWSIAPDQHLTLSGKNEKPFAWDSVRSQAKIVAVVRKTFGTTIKLHLEVGRVICSFVNSILDRGCAHRGDHNSKTYNPHVSHSDHIFLIQLLDCVAWRFLRKLSALRKQPSCNNERRSRKNPGFTTSCARAQTTLKNCSNLQAFIENLVAYTVIVSKWPYKTNFKSYNNAYCYRCLAGFLIQV